MAHKISKSPFGGLFDEVRKVSWPSRQETLKLTVVVIVVSFFVGVYVGLLDIVFAQGLKLFTK